MSRYLKVILNYGEYSCSQTTCQRSETFHKFMLIKIQGKKQDRYNGLK